MQVQDPKCKSSLVPIITWEGFLWLMTFTKKKKKTQQEARGDDLVQVGRDATKMIGERGCTGHRGWLSDGEFKSRRREGCTWSTDVLQWCESNRALGLGWLYDGSDGDERKTLTRERERESPNPSRLCREGRGRWIDLGLLPIWDSLSSFSFPSFSYIGDMRNVGSIC